MLEKNWREIQEIGGSGKSGFAPSYPRTSLSTADFMETNANGTIISSVSTLVGRWFGML